MFDVYPATWLCLPAMFLHLVYASRATQSFSGLALNNLIERSKAKNEHHGITAVLLHQRGLFLHGVEGQAAEVRAIYAIVRADPRHRDARVLVETSVCERLFIGQPMGFHDTELRESEGVQTDKEGLGLPEEFHQGLSWKGCVAIQLLRPFWS